MKEVAMNIQDYVFEYQNKDCNNAKLKYKFDEISSINFKDTKEKEKKQTIYFELIAFNNKKEYEIDFSLNMTLEDLNKLNDEIILINDKIRFVEFYDDGNFKDPQVSNNNIYTKSNNFYVLKKNKNEFVFKIEIFDENLFIWFNIKF